MFTISGFEKNIQNVYKLSRPYSEQEITNYNELRGSYLKFLAYHNPNILINHSNDHFVRDLRIQDNLIGAYGEKSNLNDLKQGQCIALSDPEENSDEKIEFAKDALSTLLSLDPNLEKVFNLVNHSIFLRRSSKVPGVASTFGGSTSKAVGVIYISDMHKMTKLDVMEVLIHELTHCLVFVDELNYPLFQYDEIKKEENYARSAILLKSRPLDKVVHSIVVGTEILCARKKYNLDGERNVHPKNNKLIIDILDSCNSVLSAKNLDKNLYPRAIKIVNDCVKVCEDLFLGKKIYYGAFETNVGKSAANA
jgi:hypothetical protein